ncbi:hypothetical protein BO82DRAFT_349985 [Aspergillus uvarum CBS 121591]|uniref:Uncharacterized protein n=1 Tax=Aspergillus uvarum CBS 121591 TaxID=1448315 RepID=A0A319CN70_9EURO|nr:hypothetical protein BO82DRAFT_349985 [Aspergillus uvarum CBS 121591]PYH86875.1 hypothetical protein BO82DRAFT_349985 [Aspergillus uvarum CBS 121591]
MQASHECTLSLDCPMIKPSSWSSPSLSPSRSQNRVVLLLLLCTAAATWPDSVTLRWVWSKIHLSIGSRSFRLHCRFTPQT